MIVYRHRTKDTFKVFYVGVGSEEKRAHFKHGRNSIWNNVVNKHGYTIEIIARDLTKEMAFELEVLLIGENLILPAIG